jgi:hypothetical protein
MRDFETVIVRQELAHQNNSQNSNPKLIVIFPAKNEERTIENSIATGKGYML